MDFDIVFFVEYCWHLFSGSVTCKLFFTVVVAILLWGFLRLIYVVATADSGIHYVSTERQSLKMVTHYKPFAFKADLDTASYSGIKGMVSTEKSCYVQALWGVPAKSLFKLLKGETEIIRNAILTSDPSQMFSKYCIDCHPYELIGANEERVLEFTPKDSTEAELLDKVTVSRELYPFVLLMVAEDEAFQHSTTAAIATAIHVPDERFKHHPYVIDQYIKMSNGDLGLAKPIYRSFSTTDNDGDNSDCVVCYSRPVSIVYLPCRHACVCSECFKSCDRCPICRSAPTNHFQLPDQEAN